VTKAKKPNLFVKPQNINWVRGAFFIGLGLLVWTGLATLLPPHIYTPISVILVTLDKSIAYIMRADVFVGKRTEKGQGSQDSVV
jgi:cytosine/uracil/thiamine/allantoin permease